MSSRQTQITSASDGRTLCLAQWGDLEGRAVFSLHGGPGSRFALLHGEQLYAELGARVITYDRPGYGGSDRHRGRRVVDCAADVAAIADSLGIERFAVTGGSLGGPHALAVGARLSDRVTKVVCAVAPAPFDAADLDWFAGMDPLNVAEIRWAQEGEEVLAREFEREATKMLQEVGAEPGRLSEDWQLPESDRRNLARPEVHDVMRQTITEAFRNGVWGYVDDTLCLVRPWGFDVSEIRTPTRVVYGQEDVLSPRQHGEWLAQHIPGAEPMVVEGAGHLLVSDPEHVRERFAWLLDGLG